MHHSSVPLTIATFELELREKLGELMEKVDAFTETVDIMSDTVDRLQNELDEYVYWISYAYHYHNCTF